jgi:hypothetical protein
VAGCEEPCEGHEHARAIVCVCVRVCVCVCVCARARAWALEEESAWQSVAPDLIRQPRAADVVTKLIL